MTISDPNSPDHEPAEPRLHTRRLTENNVAEAHPPRSRLGGRDPLRTPGNPEPSERPGAAIRRDARSAWRSPQQLTRAALLLLVLLSVLATACFFFGRYWIRSAAHNSLPQIDGTLALAGLSAPVTVQRDAHGVPHIHAVSLDDLVFAQGFVTAGDRLFQMDLLRRHAAGELAEILGSSVIPHDRLQRTLQIRAAADRAVTQLPPDQLHVLELYARGVNASIAQQASHLPVEFRVLRYRPAPWTPRDSILVSLAMFEDLTNTFPAKLARESLTARLPAELVPDLYPVGSWRDHPPTSPEPDLTVPGPPIEQVPLDESQARLTPIYTPPVTPASILSALRPLLENTCTACTPGSNNWVVSGAHTASGKPLLANDMHLNHTVPGIWYEADLEVPASVSGIAAEPFHVAGVSLPGVPLIIVGHNAHIAWGFTNLGADVQDVYVETTRNTGAQTEFQSADNTWHSIIHLPEQIKVRGGRTVSLDVTATRHGDTVTPILNPILAPALADARTLSLRWTLYDPALLKFPFVAVNSAHDWPSFVTAFSTFGGPAQNVVYADDAGHIGYHAIGRIPLRGPNSSANANPTQPTTSALPSDIANPLPPPASTVTPTIAATPDPLNRTAVMAPPVPSLLLGGALSPVPIPTSAVHEWSGYIPFDQLPQVLDPPGGVIATANSRVTPDDYKYPITLDWAAPYRNERIWRALAQRTGLIPSDMLAIQTDVYSDFDHVLAQRLAYALDNEPANQLNHATKGIAPENVSQAEARRQAADLLRKFNGRMAIDSPAAAIIASVHAVLWPMLLAPHLDGNLPSAAGTKKDSTLAATNPRSTPTRPTHTSRSEIEQLYTWGEKDYALEQILMHTPPRWLPPPFKTWDDFLTAAVDRGLAEGKAPANLSTWRYGAVHTLDIEHPLFAQSSLLRHLLGLPTGTGPQPQSGDATTVKQVGHSFGPSERFTADLGNPDHSTFNIVLGQSGNAESPWFLDQFPAWYRGTTFSLPFSDAAVSHSITHTLTLTPVSKPGAPSFRLYRKGGVSSEARPHSPGTATIRVDHLPLSLKSADPHIPKM